MAEETEPDLDAEAEPGPRARRLVRGAERAALATTLAPDADGGGAWPYVSLVLGAAVYADFKDFRLYRMAVESAHLVAGFGCIHWLKFHDILFDAGTSAAFAEAEAAILGHMNRDHGEALGLIAERLLGLPKPAP